MGFSGGGGGGTTTHLDPAQDQTAAAALAEDSLVDKDILYIEDDNKWYAYDRQATAATTGATFQPSDAAGATGWWIAVNPPTSGGGDLLSTNNLSDVASASTSLSNLGGEPAFSKNTAFNKDFGTSAGTVLEGDKNAAIALNTAKATNATHIGEVTGSGALTLDSTSISNKASVTAASGMEVLVNDAGTLKKSDASDFLGGGTYFKAEVTITSTTPTITPSSASDQIVPGLTYTITQDRDYVFYAMVTGDLDNTDAKPFQIMLAKNGSVIANSKTGDFMKKNEAQSVSLTFPIDGLVNTDVIDVYINNDNIDVEITLGRMLIQSWA